MDDRKLEVLRAIVTDYVSSQEPVGSKALVDRHDLGVSPATVRNDMAALVCGWVMYPSSSSAAMSLRTVAGETPRSCRSTRALEPTGSWLET